ncbi:histidine ammonia-lyase [Candidatus Bathyarchaeota archaeon]|nr:MAG: histidine ammonia-lyase [Candidatus Bathyarchaeota archaeon]
MVEKVPIDGRGLSLEDLVAVARGLAPVEVPDAVVKRLEENRRLLEELVEEGVRCSGVNTGLGPLSHVVLGPDEAGELQENIIKSHATGVGPSLPTDVVRAAMLLRANTLAVGHSGVRPEVLARLASMLNSRAHPVVPSRGSVGASGDLVPLAHMALAVVGSPHGLVELGGRILRADEALGELGLGPLGLSYKEGLALVNGTSFSTAVLALATYDSLVLSKTADIALAMSLEAVGGRLEPFDHGYLSLRPFRGQMACAENVRRLVRGSRLVGHPGLGRAQDPYCLRCAPQVHGSAREALALARRLVEVELNSADDNPLIFAEEPRCRTGGNFHAQPLALAADVLSIGLCYLGNISERRTNFLLKGGEGVLPPFLVGPGGKPGLQSGLMLAQYTAASLAAENRALSCPASVQNIPTGADFEDVVSMSMAAALKARQILENTTRILAIEVLCAFQALALRGPEGAGDGTRAAYRFLEGRGLEPLTEDRPTGRDVELVSELVSSGGLLSAVEEALGDRLK